MSSYWTLRTSLIMIMLHGVRSQIDPTAAQCLNPISREMEFSLTSHKDHTGRWVAEVDMEHDTDDRISGAWRVDVKCATSGCAGSARVKLTAKITAPQLPVAPGYEFHRGVGYYKLHMDKKTWHEAKRTCESEGTHLAILNSEAEAKVLKNMLARVPENVSTWAFLGFHDIYEEGQFLTVFDEPLNATGFTRWTHKGQPDNAGASATHPGEDCGTIDRRTGGLNDLSCLSNVLFFCEQELT